MEFDLERFHSGDECLFAELLAVHPPRLWRHLCHYSGPGVDARDLLQEAWLRAFHKRHTFDGRGSFIGWLLMVGCTVGLAAVRKGGRLELMQRLRLGVLAITPVDPAALGKLVSSQRAAPCTPNPAVDLHAKEPLEQGYRPLRPPGHRLA